MSFRYENDMLSNLFVFSRKEKKDSKKSKDRSFKSIRVLSHITNFISIMRTVPSKLPFSLFG